MRIKPFTSADRMKRSERALPEDERRQAIRHVEMLLNRALSDDEQRRFLPTEQTCSTIEAGGTIEQSAAWSPAERRRFVAVWLGVGTALAVIILGILEIWKPWSH